MMASSYRISSPQTTPAPANVEAGMHVLYVDSDERRRHGIWELLTEQAIAATVVDSAEAGLAELAVDDNFYTVVVAEASVGANLDGIGFLACARDLSPTTGRVAVLRPIEIARAVQAFNEGGVEQIVPKPWAPDELLTALRQASARAMATRSAQQVQRRLELRAQELQTENWLLEERLDQARGHLFEGLLGALALRDVETHGHAQRVASYARRVALELGITGEPLADVEHGALLHDVGKIGVPDSILLKPGRLDPREWSVMQKHPVLGHRLLEGLDGFKAAADIVLHHHERFDGAGYPFGKRGEEIPIGARIFSVVDALDVITTARPYKRARSWDWAREEIERCSGAHFDPDVVDAYQRVADDEWALLHEEHCDEQALAV